MLTPMALKRASRAHALKFIPWSKAYFFSMKSSSGLTVIPAVTLRLLFGAFFFGPGRVRAAPSWEGGGPCWTRGGAAQESGGR